MLEGVTNNITVNKQNPYWNMGINSSIPAQAITGTLERQPIADNVELTKKTISKQTKTLLTLGGFATAVIGTVLAVKGYRSHQISKGLEQIEQKFLKLQENIPEVQKTFKDVFLRGDITEKEALEILNRYKEVEKLGITGTKEEYIKALFKEANSNYGMKPIKLIIENQNKSTIGGATSPINEYISINPNMSIDEYWDIIHHELRHAKQHILGYNSNPELARKVIASQENFETSIQQEVGKFIDELIERGFTGNEIKEQLASKYKNELSEILRNNFGDLNPNNIPKTQKKLAEDLINSFAERDGIEYMTNHGYYKERFFEIDARYAGESIAKLFKKPIFVKS